LSAVSDFLFNIFAAISISGSCLLHPQPKDASCRDDRSLNTLTRWFLNINKGSKSPVTTSSLIHFYCFAPFMTKNTKSVHRVPCVFLTGYILRNKQTPIHSVPASVVWSYLSIIMHLPWRGLEAEHSLHPEPSLRMRGAIHPFSSSCLHGAVLIKHRRNFTNFTFLL